MPETNAGLRYRWLLLGCLLLAIPCRAAQPPAIPPACAHDREVLLALPEPAFDQDLSNGGGGWRTLAARQECVSVAADLIRDYRHRRGVEGGILAWHEGQLRAEAGDVAQAIALFERARKPDGEKDPIGWNAYVDASVAFLRNDRAALAAARARLAATPYRTDGDMPPLKDGVIAFPAQEGRPAVRMRWPPNLDVVDGLIRCFAQPYRVAYGSSCRPPALVQPAAPAKAGQ